MSSSWKQLLTEAESLTKLNGNNAWRTAQIIRDVLKDKDFLEDCRDNQDEADGRVEKYSQRFGLRRDEMLAMIERYPRKRDWMDGRLCDLRDKVMREIASEAWRARKNGNSNKTSKKTPRKQTNGKPRVPVSEHERDFPLPVMKGEPADYAEAVEVVERLREEVIKTEAGQVSREEYEALRDSKDAKIAELQAKVKELMKEVTTLRRENKKLNSRFNKVRRELQVA